MTSKLANGCLPDFEPVGEFGTETGVPGRRGEIVNLRNVLFSVTEFGDENPGSY
jgi:hypothetical protein